MQLRLECYAPESGAVISSISDVLNVKSVSKGYANVRQTAVEGTPCEYRYYLKLDERTPIKPGSSNLDLLTTDMLRFLSMLSDGFGFNAAPEIESLRKLYVGSAGMTERQILQLFMEWRASLLGRCLKQRGGGMRA
mgnify:CR=1 FL=1